MILEAAVFKIKPGGGAERKPALTFVKRGGSLVTTIEMDR